MAASFQPEPPFAHGQAPRTAVLYCNLGTPDEPTTAGRAPLPRRVPGRSARGRDPAPDLVAAAVRPHPALPLGEVGRQVREHLAPRGLAAEAVDRQAGQAAARLAGRARPPRHGALRDALRQPVDRLAAGRAEGRGRDAHPRAVGLSAVLGHHHGQRDRRRHRLVGARAQPAGAALRQPLPRRPRLRPGAGAAHRAPLARARPRRPPGDELPRRARAHAAPGRPLSLRMPEDRPPAGGASRPGKGPVQRDLPVALRQGQVARALHRAVAARARATRRGPRGRGVPGLHRRLPGNAGRNRHGRQARLPGRRAARSSSTSPA